MRHKPQLEILNQNSKTQYEAHQKFNEKNLVRVIRSLHRQITHEINQKLADAGYEDLSARHLSVFEYLDFTGTNIVTLASRAGISKQAMSKLVKEVLSGEYVKVLSDDKDFRAQIVYFTPKGLDLLDYLRQEITDYSFRFNNQQNITNDAVSTTFETLSKLHDFLVNSDNKSAVLN